jgi:hypothetical protein
MMEPIALALPASCSSTATGIGGYFDMAALVAERGADSPT